jgi:hypothetical protein
MSDFKNGELSFSKLIVWLFYDDQVVLATLLCQHFVEDFHLVISVKGALPLIPAEPPFPSFRRRPESSGSDTFLDSGPPLRYARNDEP